MIDPKLDLLCNENREEFFALVSEYLPGSSRERAERYSQIFPKAFIVMTLGGEMIGAAFGWHRKLEFPDDDSFVLNGIAVKNGFRRKGYGKMLLEAFERAAAEYGVHEITLGSAPGDAEKFYLACGYFPREYKVWENNAPLILHSFESMDDYYSYKRTGDGFVVMCKYTA